MAVQENMAGIVCIGLNADFRTGIRLEMTAVSELDDTEKLMRILLLYYGDISGVPSDVGAAFTAVMNFYHCDKDNASQGGTATNRRTQIYSFEHDAPYIYAAFLEQYGIDLTQENDLHWWRFQAMFDSLSEKTQFVKIMGYRSMTITKDMSPQQKEFYRRMQKTYAIPVSKTEREKTTALEQALLNGGDITELL